MNFKLHVLLAILNVVLAAFICAIVPQLNFFVMLFSVFGVDYLLCRGAAANWNSRKKGVEEPTNPVL